MTIYKGTKVTRDNVVALFESTLIDGERAEWDSIDQETRFVIACEETGFDPDAIDQGAALAESPVDYIAAVPATLETLQEAEFWHGYLMAESLRMAAGKRSPSEYDQARRRYHDALRASGLTGSAVDQMLRDTRASVLFAHTDGDTVERGEYTLTATTEYDNSHGAPWQECDGHGPVSEWTTRDKLPGELVLCSDHGCKHYYDYAEACRAARAEGWGFLPAPQY